MRNTAVIGDNVARLAGAHLIQQRDLAAVLGMTRNGLANIMARRADPSMSTAIALSRAFGVPVEVFGADDPAVVLRAAADGWHTSEIVTSGHQRKLTPRGATTRLE